jgi:hypothetical protein
MVIGLQAEMPGAALEPRHGGGICPTGAGEFPSKIQAPDPTIWPFA